MKKLILAFVVAFGVVSCGSDTKTADETVTETETTTEQAPEETAADDAVSNTIHLEANDQMRYDATEFTVKAGEPITLTLKNVGELPVESMGHNVMVLKIGSDVKEFAMAGMSHKDTEYIAPELEDEVIAHTIMLGPGEEDTITFTLDEPGVYPFLCSFPGHFGTMNGTITVVE